MPEATEPASWPASGGEMARRIREFDWAQTPLGPIETWPRSLKTTVDLMLAMKQPSAVCWGKDLIFLYNDPGADIIGDQHPAGLGQPVLKRWPEFGDALEELLANVMAGESQDVADRPFTHRGRPDLPNAWFTLSWTPVRRESGDVGGAFALATETTGKVVAEQVSRENENRYRLFAERATDGIWLADQSGRFVEVNPAACRILGYSGEEHLRLTVRDIVRPDEATSRLDALMRRLAHGEHITDVWEIRCANGTYVPLELSHVFTSDGRWQAIGRDISERQPSEERVQRAADLDAFRVALDSALRPLADAVEVQVVACRLLGEHLGADRAYYAEVNQAQQFARIDQQYSRGDSPSLVGMHQLVDYGWTVPFLERGETIVVADTDTATMLTGPDRAAMAAVKMAAHISTPVLKADALVGALCVSEPTPREWSAAEIELVSETADRLWAAIDRARAESALRESEERLHLALDSAEIGTFIWHVKEDRAEWDTRMLALFDQPPDGTLTLQSALTTMIHPDDAERYAAAVARAYDPDGEGVLREDIRVRRAGGAVRWLAITGQIRFGRDPRQATHMVGAAMDISGRKATEAALLDNDARQQFLLRLSDALRPLSDPVEIQTVASRLLCEHLQANRVAYAEFEGDEIIVHRDHNNGVPSIAGRYPKHAFGQKVLDLFLSTGTVLENDIPSSPDFSVSERNAFDALNVAAYLGSSLSKDGRIAAAFAAHSATPRVWTADEITLVKDVAERIWATIERARAEAALRRSEARYRTLFESIDEGFAIVDLISNDDGRVIDYRFVEVNPAFARMTGIAGDVVGRTALEIDPTLEPVWFKMLRRVAETGEPARFERRVASLGRDFTVFATRVGGVGSHRLAVVFRDITERKQSRAALQTSEARFRSFAEASVDTLWIVNAASGSLEYLSPAFERMWGEPPDRVVADLGHWAELVHPDDRAQAATGLPRILAGERVVIEYRIIRPVDGAIRWIRDTGFPILDAAGRVQRAAGIAQDITDKELAEAERMTFIDAAAHDLKTPLTSLRGQAQLLLRRSRRGQAAVVSGETLETGLTRIDDAAGRMVGVIDEMLDAAHLQAEHALDLEVAPTDLAALVANAVEEARRGSHHHVIRVETDRPSLVGAWDGVRLARVLDNLIGNAVKYSPDGGRVIVRVRREEDASTGDAGPGEGSPDGWGWAVVSIHDHGIGIPASDLPHLFQRFHRGGNVSRIRGTGIGLAGARQIVEQHGGTLTAESEEGRGSTFVVRLPLARASAPIQGGAAREPHV